MKKQKTLMTGVSITAIEDKIVREYMAKTGVNNFSAALRMIIREWNEAKQQKINHKESETQPG